MVGGYTVCVIGVGCGCLVGASYFSFGQSWGKARARSVGGISIYPPNGRKKKTGVCPLP